MATYFNSHFKVKPGAKGFKPRSSPLKRSTFKKKAKPLKRARKDTVGKLKSRLWELCRQIIFKRYQNAAGEVFCFTSGQGPLVGSNRHLGHFVPSSVGGVSLRYDLDNLRPQSYVENVHKSGNWPAYYENLVKEIGQDRVDALLAKKKLTVKADRLFYETRIAEYEGLLAQLERSV